MTLACTIYQSQRYAAHSLRWGSAIHQLLLAYTRSSSTSAKGNSGFLRGLKSFWQAFCHLTWYLRWRRSGSWGRTSQKRLNTDTGDTRQAAPKLGQYFDVRFIITLLEHRLRPDIGRHGVYLCLLGGTNARASWCDFSQVGHRWLGLVNQYGNRRVLRLFRAMPSSADAAPGSHRLQWFLRSRPSH